MKAAAVVLIPLLAAAGGVGAWLALKPATPGGPGASSASPRAPADPEVERRLEEAVRLLKEADGLEGDERKSRGRRAAEILDQLARRRPDDVDVAYWGAMAAVFAGDSDAAHAALIRVKELLPDRGRAPLASYLQAVIQMTFEPDKIESALRMLKGLPSRAPEFRPQEVAATTYKALRQWATHCLEIHNGESALAALQEAEKLVLDQPEPLFDTKLAIAHAMGWNSRWPEATDAWLQLERDTKGLDPEVEMGLGDAYAIQNDNAKAAEHFTRVMEIMERVKDPPPRYRALREVLLRRGNAYRLLGKDGETKAKADLEAYVARFPDDPRGWFWLGVFRFEQLEDAAAARVALEKARSLAPYCDQYLRLLLQVLETTSPDSADVKALRREMDEGAAARAKKREEVRKARGDMRNLCE